MFRTSSSQPPIELTPIVSAGRIECCTADPMNCPLNPMLSSGSYPPDEGSSDSTWVNTYTSSSASQKYGIAVRNVVAGTRLSSQVPRFQPVTTPSAMPTTKLITVAAPTSRIVHKMDCLITVDTGTGNSYTDSPSRRCARLSRYCQYLVKIEPVPSPSSFVSDAASPGGTVPKWAWCAMMISTGFPGMSRGRKKFNVSATQAAIT